MQKSITLLLVSVVLLVTLLSVIELTTAAAATPKFKSKYGIKKVVLLMLENRAFDHLLGFSAKNLHVNGLTGNEYNPVSTLDPRSPKVYVDQTAPFIAPLDPDHATYAQTSKIYGMKNLLDMNYSETMLGFVEWEHMKNKKAPNSTTFSVMRMFSPEHLPVMNQLAAEFAIMDEFFCSVPGSTWPNRGFGLAATSGGNTETYFWQDGVPGQLYETRTILDQVAEEGGTWKNYIADAPWENFLASIALQPQNVQHMDHFFADAASGNLPTLSYINPRGGINMTTGQSADDMHPCHDVRLAEKLSKDVYEALRASPDWPHTAFILYFDENGGFFDHVPPPTKDVPAPDDFKPIPDFYFKFDRLGIRVPSLIISPRIPKGPFSDWRTVEKRKS